LFSKFDEWLVGGEIKQREMRCDGDLWSLARRLLAGVV